HVPRSIRAWRMRRKLLELREPGERGHGVDQTVAIEYVVAFRRGGACGKHGPGRGAGLHEAFDLRRGKATRSAGLLQQQGRHACRVGSRCAGAEEVREGIAVRIIAGEEERRVTTVRRCDIRLLANLGYRQTGCAVERNRRRSRTAEAFEGGSEGR